MSNYVRETRHPVTGEWEQAWWVDDLLGRRRYGVVFPSDGGFGPEMRDIAYDPDQTAMETRDPGLAAPSVDIAPRPTPPAETVWDPVEELIRHHGIALYDHVTRTHGDLAAFFALIIARVREESATSAAAAECRRIGRMMEQEGLWWLATTVRRRRGPKP